MLRNNSKRAAFIFIGGALSSAPSTVDAVSLADICCCGGRDTAPGDKGLVPIDEEAAMFLQAVEEGGKSKTELRLPPMVHNIGSAAAAAAARGDDNINDGESTALPTNRSRPDSLWTKPSARSEADNTNLAEIQHPDIPLDAPSTPGSLSRATSFASEGGSSSLVASGNGVTEYFGLFDPVVHVSLENEVPHYNIGKDEEGKNFGRGPAAHPQEGTFPIHDPSADVVRRVRLNGQRGQLQGDRYALTDSSEVGSEHEEEDYGDFDFDEGVVAGLE